MFKKFDVNDIPLDVIEELTNYDCKAQLKALLDRVEEEVNKYKTTYGISGSNSYEIGKNHGRQEARSNFLATLKEIRKSI